MRLKIKKSLVILSLLLLLTAILPFTTADVLEEFSNLEQDLVGTTLPGPLGTLFANERINLYLTLNDSSEITFGLITKQKVVEEFSMSEVEDPTVNVYTSEATVQNIIDAENPIKELKDALDNKEINYEALGFTKKIKFGVSGLFVKIASWFS